MRLHCDLNELDRVRIPPRHGLINHGVDVDMPGRTGVELLVSLLNAGSEIPVILVTARATAEVREIASWGKAIVLEKPFTMDALEAAVLESRTA